MITIQPSPAVTRRFEALYDAHADRVMAYALRHLGPDEAEDVVAETFLVAWRRVADVPGPETAVAEREALIVALARLSEDDREALLLTAWDGLPARDAAAVLGCTTAAFGVRLHRARRRLVRYADEPVTDAPRGRRHEPDAELTMTRDHHQRHDPAATTILTRLAMLAPTDLDRAAPGWASRRTGLRTRLLETSSPPGEHDGGQPAAGRGSPAPAPPTPRRRWVPVAAAAATTSVPAPLGDLAAVTNDLAEAARTHPFPVQRPGTYSYRKVAAVENGRPAVMTVWADFDGRLWGRTTPPGATPGRVESQPTWQDNPDRGEAAKLPGEPVAMWAWFTRSVHGTYANERFHGVEDLLANPWLTGAQRAALFRVFARLPGVSRPSYGRDSAGRLGVLLRGPYVHGLIIETLYDPVTAMPLEVRKLRRVPQGAPSSPRGSGTNTAAPIPTGPPGSYQVQERATLLDLAVVDRLPTS